MDPMSMSFPVCIEPQCQAAALEAQVGTEVCASFLFYLRLSLFTEFIFFDIHNEYLQ